MKIDNQDEMEWREALAIIERLIDFYVAWLKFLKLSLMDHKTFIRGYLKEEQQHIPEEKIIRDAWARIIKG
jgi:hypothetical protein